MFNNKVFVIYMLSVNDKAGKNMNFAVIKAVLANKYISLRLLSRIKNTLKYMKGACIFNSELFISLMGREWTYSACAQKFKFKEKGSI